MARTSHGILPQRKRPSAGPRIVLGAALFLAAAVTGLIALRLTPPNALIIAAAATFLVVAACLVALAAPRKPAWQTGLTYWDVVGALVFIGIGVAALVDPQEIAVIAGGPREP